MGRYDSTICGDVGGPFTAMGYNLLVVGDHNGILTPFQGREKCAPSKLWGVQDGLEDDHGWARTAQLCSFKCIVYGNASLGGEYSQFRGPQ